MEQKLELKTGTLIGTTLSLIASVQWIDIEKTLILGSIGAACSFLVTWCLQKLLNRKRE